MDKFNRMTNEYWRNDDPWELCDLGDYCKRRCVKNGEWFGVAPKLWSLVAYEEKAENHLPKWFEIRRMHMNRNNVLLFIGMAMNAEKQHEENLEAIRQETGLDYAAVYHFSTPELQVLDGEMEKICDALHERPKVKERNADNYPYELSVMVEGVKVYTICKAIPDYA